MCGAQGGANFQVEPDACLAACGCRREHGHATQVRPAQWWQDAYAEQAGEQDRAKRMAILRKMEDFLIFEDPGGTRCVLDLGRLDLQRAGQGSPRYPARNGAASSTTPIGVAIAGMRSAEPKARFGPASRRALMQAYIAKGFCCSSRPC